MGRSFKIFSTRKTFKVAAYSELHIETFIKETERMASMELLMESATNLEIAPELRHLIDALNERILEMGASSAWHTTLVSEDGEGTPFLDAVAKTIATAEEVMRQAHRVGIDYRWSIEEMIGMCNLGHVSPCITSRNFPIQGKSIVNTEIIPVPFPKTFTRAGALQKLHQIGLKVAKIEHLLALGRKWANVKQTTNLLCLGSSWTFPGGMDGYPYLQYEADERALDLTRSQSWDNSWSVLAVQ